MKATSAYESASSLPILLIQKSSRTSKTKQHITLFKRRLGVWSNHNLDELVREGRTIVQRLPKNGPTKADSNLFLQPYVHRELQGYTLDLLSGRGKGSVTMATSTLMTQSLHCQRLTGPKAPCGSTNSCIILDEPQNPHPMIIESLDASAICLDTLSVNNAAGLQNWIPMSGGTSAQSQGCIEGSLFSTCISCCQSLYHTSAPLIHCSTPCLSSRRT